MGRNGSINYQIKKKLTALYRFGVSKREAKKNGETYGIHSKKTFDVYCEHLCRMAKKIQAETGAKTLDEILSYVPAFLKKQAESGDYSVWTLKLELAAVAKFISCPSSQILLPGWELPKRMHGDIKRSRTSTKADEEFSEERNADAVTIGYALGLRRHEYPQMIETQIIDGQIQPGWRTLDKRDVENGLTHEYWMNFFHVFVAKGKGGRARWVPVYPGMETEVIEILKRRSVTRNGKAFYAYDLRSRMDCHGYRRMYAKAMYNHLMSRPDTDKTLNYHCRGERFGESYSRSCAEGTSRSLGHNRVDVVIGNYLDS